MSVKKIDLAENNLLFNVHQSNEITYLTKILQASKSKEFIMKEEDYYKLWKELDPWDEEKIRDKVFELEFILYNLKQYERPKDVWMMYALGLDTEALMNFKIKKETK
jgi:hypothetical protein